MLGIIRSHDCNVPRAERGGKKTQTFGEVQVETFVDIFLKTIEDLHTH